MTIDVDALQMLEAAETTGLQVCTYTCGQTETCSWTCLITI